MKKESTEARNVQGEMEGNKRIMILVFPASSPCSSERDSQSLLYPSPSSMYRRPPLIRKLKLGAGAPSSCQRAAEQGGSRGSKVSLLEPRPYPPEDYHYTTLLPLTQTHQSKCRLDRRGGEKLSLFSLCRLGIQFSSDFSGHCCEARAFIFDPRPCPDSVEARSRRTIAREEDPKAAPLQL